MEKKRKLQLATILAAMFLTIYNILPTLFFYSQPLKSGLSKEAALKEADAIAGRVDDLEEGAQEWLAAYCKELGISPRKISSKDERSGLIALDFSKSEEAEKFKRFFPRAGSLIPFAPAQLSLCPTETPKSVLIQRKIDFRLKEKGAFQYIPKYEDGALSIQYQSLLQERVNAITKAAHAPAAMPIDSDPLSNLVETVLNIAKFYEINPELSKRLATQFSRSVDIAALKDTLAQKRDQLKLAASVDQKLEHKLASAELFLKKHEALFTSLSKEKNPFFYEFVLEANKSTVHLNLYPDVVSLLDSEGVEKHLLKQLLVDEAAKISRLTNETLLQTPFGYKVPLQEMENVSGVLSLKLDEIAGKYTAHLLSVLKKEWSPTHTDLVELPILSESEYATLPMDKKSLCLVVSAPVTEANSTLSPSLQNQSIYVVVKGINHILRTYENSTKSAPAQAFIKDFQSLSEILNRFGFTGYSGGYWKEFANDYLFEKRNFYNTLLAATRENFKVFGSKKAAYLELSDREQRILTTNKIETQIHEELVKWNDEYQSSKVSLNLATRFDFPKPPQNIFWNNLKLSLAKMLRGDEAKILRWGLDLSGGKTVQLELCDQNNVVVTDESDIKQGINELFNRVNKMGVSDVSIRQMGHHIVLDFPSSQALSAKDLVKASSMYFHIVNEKFTNRNHSLSGASERFLTEVWNEALVTNKKDPENIQEIAFRHLHGETPTEAAKILLEQGLKLAAPKTTSIERKLDETLSKVVIYRDGGDEQRSIHPLLIVFNNSALEGSNLDNIRANYDPSKGNFLSFEVKRGAAQEQLYAWTSAFSKETIQGSSRGEISQGHGWRMAVLLNDRLISAPTLESALRGSASISGSFTQREINSLASDLKAGSLTFTPRILSEKNVSPELGKADRMRGIGASIAALILVIGAMIAYYRFAGFVASVAVFFNLLILWAVLQNLGASLSLASIAGIILTVGMAVDANVLVFERMKEEFAHSKKIASAIHAGYEKAFSAIVDSNVTTIIAALILLNFDAGPIKAFAISMIIGIASSMFTALFMTRFYFNGWLKNPNHTTLNMANWVKASNYDFLKRARFAFSCAAIIIALGGAFLVTKRATLFGMDFTGGYALSIETAAEVSSEKIGAALQKAGASPANFHFRKLQSNQYELLLGIGMEEVGQPFYNLPLQNEEKNPRIEWVQNTLHQANIQLSPSSEKGLENSWATLSGQMSESMRNNAIIGLLLAFLAIFIYIAFRFEYKYAIAALLCLFHDVLITLGLIGLLHALKVPVQIDLNTIAALMTIIGYSLNDTIIIFDRIREDVRLYPHLPMKALVNRSLNATLSRTSITSGTTLLVLLALLFLGGATLFSFSLVMVIGIIFGTLSSWFIASPLMLFFHKKELIKQEA